MDNMTDVTELPMWMPWVYVKSQSNDPEGRAIRVASGSMTKDQAWKMARAEMEKRQDVTAMAVRRDNEPL